MRFSRAIKQPAEGDALEACVQGARQALACAFSTSEEYEAALIQERRAAGAYGANYTYHRIAGIALIAILIAGIFVIL